MGLMQERSSLRLLVISLSVAHSFLVASGPMGPRAAPAVRAARRIAMAEGPAAGAVAENPEPTKKNVRRRIMGAESYKRGGSPFDKAIHKDVSSKMSEMFAGELVEQMKASPFRELEVGEGSGQITFVLAKEFGFCWGVERSIELAWAARDAYPEKKMHT